ncbi:RecQ family ATP-dependent DNA helicase [Vibrio salinus]|uniref:RecQ family ATP-dependent DNA helicase n=1 Tax=Vibrio salinus TaxID=2899784 RepID=UPI001E3BB465|nr:RecQ family ATP-dependent DNA helicase [Vibrio salinus]MCE0494790.1 RecQ family ATP-dependent DNA helicase [Vibrio salinus]
MQQLLQQYFGFNSLRPGQSDVIRHILNGQSAAAIFPTGSGKSLCYQLPAMQLPHLTLVISPLLALIKDQVEFLRSKGIPADSIHSGQDTDTTQAIMHQVKSGKLKILMISVERLKNERFRHFISEIPISLLVVDEAHCISEWGHNFRPDYLKLPEYRKWLKIPQVLLLTATATPQVIDDMSKKFDIPDEAVIVTGFYRPNLNLNIIPCSEKEKFHQLHSIINKSPEASTIVYVTLQKTAETIATKLQESGINAIAYHAGLDNELRAQIQQRFMQDTSTCIVATIAFGMGIDKANIRNVIHFDLPKSIENYSQEIGRAGRDGQPSECIILANTDHVSVLENFVYGDTPDKSSIEYVIHQIYSATNQWEVMLSSLSRDSNIRQLPLKTLLVYLEMDNIIESRFSYFATYRFKLIESTEHITNYFSGERRSFVEAVFQCTLKARLWYTIDFEALWQTFHADRKRVIAALEYFQGKGWIELENKQITDVYSVLDKQKPESELADRLYNLFILKEKNEIQRIHNMIDFFQSHQCLSYTLASYFADLNAPKECHHCSVCAGRIAQLNQQERPPINAQQLITWIHPYKQAGSNRLSDKAISHFLCGITTPLSIRLKATKMEGFGKLAHYPFAEVHKKVLELTENKQN